MLIGTIQYASDETDFLTSLGIEIVATTKLATGFAYECRVSEAAMSRLDPHWGRFIWSLKSDGFQFF